MRTLITGTSRGIGRALLDEGATRGYSVLGSTRTGAHALDVTDPEAQARFAEETGPLDLLVCNAGVYLDKGVSFDTMTAEQMTQTFAANVTGVALTIQAQLCNLSEGGKIAIIGSKMGTQSRAPGNAFAYRASKAAVLNIGRNLATLLAPQGLAVGVYHPGWVRTDMGGTEADISVEESARGLWDRFEALTLAQTGCFEAWDGASLPF